VLPGAYRHGKPQRPHRQWYDNSSQRHRRTGSRCRDGSRIGQWQAQDRSGDKNFDTKDFVEDLRALKVTPHVAQNTTNRSSAIDGRTTRHEGYQISLKVGKLKKTDTNVNNPN